MAVTVAGDLLFVQGLNEPRLPLLVESETKFQSTATPTGFEFILYMYGPFSFDLSDELTSIRADGLLKIAVQYPYGPKLVPTDAAEAVQKRFPKTMQKYGKPVVFIASKIGAKTVADLEKLATALYVERKYDLDDEDIDSWARQMNALKSHVSLDAARAAIEDLQRIEDEASEM